MAKFEKKLHGDFDEITNIIKRDIVEGNISASLEDTSYFEYNNARCIVMVFERYSIIGENRLSLTVTLFGQDNNVGLSAIASGGSRGVLLKINTFGEEAFLKKLTDIIDRNNW